MNNLRYGIILTAILFAQSAFAHHTSKSVQTVRGIVTQSYELPATTTTIQQPVKSCEIVNVPIYGKSGTASTGEVLGGAIIGGILGNQVGGGSGKDAATILGAIIGADVANKKGGKNDTIVGYKQVENCKTVYQEQVIKNPSECKTTVTLPTMNNIEHSFISKDCYPVNTNLMMTVTTETKVKD